MHIGHRTALNLFMLDDHSHGNGFRLWIRPKILNLRFVAIRMGEDKDTGHSLHRLQRERPLPFQFLTPLFATGEQHRMAVFRELQISRRPFQPTLRLVRKPPDESIFLLQELLKREFNMGFNPINFLQPLGLYFVENRREGLLMQPIFCVASRRKSRQRLRSRSRLEIAEDTGLMQTTGSIFRHLDRKQSFMHDIA